MKRLKKGEFLAMTPEQQREHRLALQRRWKHAHKDKVSVMNKKWNDYYREYKPFPCTCKKCGSIFYARRRTNKICPVCHSLPPQYKILRIKKLFAKQEKLKIYKAFYDDYMKGLSQTEIARKSHTTQSNVNRILKSYVWMKEKEKRCSQQKN